MQDERLLKLVEDRAARVAAIRHELRKEINELKAAVINAREGGCGINEIARRSENLGGLSRRAIFDFLGHRDLREEIKALLRGEEIDPENYLFTEARNGGVRIELFEYYDPVRPGDDDGPQRSNAEYIEKHSTASALLNILRPKYDVRGDVDDLIDNGDITVYKKD